MVADSRTLKVTMYAAIGYEQRILVVRQHGDEHWRLPEVRAVFGEPVERTLRSKLESVFGTTVTFLSFLAAIERRYVDGFGRDRHELTLVFDTGLRDANVSKQDNCHETRWLSKADLSTVDLQPQELRAGLLSGAFDDGTCWLPWLLPIHRDQP